MKKFKSISKSVFPTLCFFIIAMLVSCTNINPGETHVQNVITESDFKTPPANFRPWVYYWWLKGNVTKESITHDLEQMKDQGIGGFLLFDSRGYWDDYYGRTGHVPVPLDIKHEFMSGSWREMVKHAMEEANRLGLKMSMNIANTGGALRGAWDMKEAGPKQLIWTSADVSGDNIIEVQLEEPADQKYFEDVALVAVRLNADHQTNTNKVDLNEQWNIIQTAKENAPVVSDVIDLGEFITDGKLQWKAPKGTWRIVRFGYHVIGDEGSVDILNADAVTKYFHLMGSEIIKDAGQLAGDVLTHFYNVSWEGGEPDWTNGFDKMFEAYRGYSLSQYLPLLAGFSLEDVSLNERFWRDYYKTVSECFIKNCYQTIGELCHENGMQWHSENGGPWPRNAPMFREADQLSFWGVNDMPQGEFWSDDYNILETKSNVRYTAMAAHIYERPLIPVEAFTHMTNHWTMYPHYLKAFTDINYADGANFFIWHTFTASPPEVGKPGFEYFAGTHINSNVTWFDKAGGFMEYMARCQYLLQRGQQVSDICSYVSDKNYVRWGRGKNWESKSALNPMDGTTFDLLDSEVLVHRLSVKDGNLVLPGGRSYKLLVVDLHEPMIRFDVLNKIAELAKAGATIVLGNTVPSHAPGLESHKETDAAIVELQKELWGTGNDKQIRTFGKGNIYTGYTMEEVHEALNILPDFEGPFQYVHQSTELEDIYFVTGEGSADCIFRVEGKSPEIWDPVSGNTTEAPVYYSTSDGRTAVHLKLQENGSTFVVFRKDNGKKSVKKITGPELPENHLTSANETQFVFWKAGSYQFTDENDKSVEQDLQTDAPINLSEDWQVSFEPASGGDKMETSFDDLVLWNEHTNSDIKYFSGTAVYSKSFDISKEQGSLPARLVLGDVHNVSRVWLNGEDLGVLWTKPWIVPLTGLLREGSNEVKIEVTNCWANRMIGDAGLPEDQRVIRTNVRLVPDRSTYKLGYQATAATDPLLASGLEGPVLIEFGVLHNIEL